jgi:PDZ domain/Aspartyl protease
MIRVILGACLGILGASLLQAGPFVLKPDERKAITIPFEQLVTGHIAIQVKINGKGPYRVMFDTGAPGVMFSGKVAKESGLISKDARPLSFGQYTATVKAASVQIGAFKAEGIVPQVMDHPTLVALASVIGALDGQVGMTLFGPDKLTIDYQARTLTILPARESKISNDEDKKREYLAPAALWGITVKKPGVDDQPGVTITAVRDGSAAARAGLKTGDRLLTMSRRWTDSVEDVYRAAAFVWAGKTVNVTLRRGDKKVDLQIKPHAGI